MFNPKALRPAHFSAWLLLPVSSLPACASRPFDSTESDRKLLPIHSASADSRDIWLVVHPDPVGLGALPMGGSAQAKLTLHNPRTVPLTVDRIETSCPCVWLTPGSVCIEPGGTVMICVMFDPSEEPGFQGGLAVDVTGYGPESLIVFRTKITLEVRPRPTNEVEPGA